MYETFCVQKIFFVRKILTLKHKNCFQTRFDIPNSCMTDFVIEILFTENVWNTKTVIKLYSIFQTGVDTYFFHLSLISLHSSNNVRLFCSLLLSSPVLTSRYFLLSSPIFNIYKRQISKCEFREVNHPAGLIK